jgi:hypothetical protein
VDGCFGCISGWFPMSIYLECNAFLTFLATRGKGNIFKEMVYLSSSNTLADFTTPYSFAQSVGDLKYGKILLIGKSNSSEKDKYIFPPYLN